MEFLTECKNSGTFAADWAEFEELYMKKYNPIVFSESISAC